MTDCYNCTPEPCRCERGTVGVVAPAPSTEAVSPGWGGLTWPRPTEPFRVPPVALTLYSERVRELDALLRELYDVDGIGVALERRIEAFLELTKGFE